MIIKKLTGLHSGIKNPKNTYIHFAHYELKNNNDLEYTGNSEEAELTDDELYELVKPMLKQSARQSERLS